MKLNRLVKQMTVLGLPLFLGLLLSVSVVTGFALAQPATQSDAEQTYWLVLDTARPVDEVLAELLPTLETLQATGQIISFDPTPQASAANAAPAVKVIASPGLADRLGSLPGVLAALDALPPAPPDGLTIQAVTLITGRVTEVVSPTNPIQSTSVDAYDGVTYLSLGSVSTGADGIYSITVNSLYDQAKLRLDGTSGCESTLPWCGYGSEWYNDKLSFNTANPISTTGGVISNTNAQLLRTDAALTGTVKLLPGNTPLVGVTLVISRVVGTSFNSAGSQNSDANGVFTFTNLISGAYILQAFNNVNAVPIISEFYDDAQNGADANRITLPSGTTQTLTFNLNASAVITGLVTDTVTGVGIPFPGVSLRDLNNDPVGDISTDANGFYRVINFGSGSYKIEFSASGYNGEWYDNIPANANGFSLATVVTATAGATRTNINAGLTPAGALITGTVTSFTGTTMADVDVTLYRYDDFDQEFFYWDDVTTNISGTYQFSGFPGLSDGVYKVLVGQDDPDIIPHAVEWFNNANVITTATRITITNGISQTNQNVQLALGSCLSGRLVDAATGLGANFWNFEVLQVENGKEMIPVINRSSFFWTYFPNSDNEGQGDFRVCGLPTGTFIVDCGEQITGTLTTAGSVADVGVCRVDLTKVYLPVIVK